MAVAAAAVLLTGCQKTVSPPGADAGRSGKEIVDIIKTPLKGARSIDVTSGSGKVHVERDGSSVAAYASVRGGVPDGIDEVRHLSDVAYLHFVPGFVQSLPKGGWTRADATAFAGGEGSLAKDPSKLSALINTSATGDAEIAWGVSQMGAVLRSDDYEGWESITVFSTSCASDVCTYQMSNPGWKKSSTGKFMVQVDSQGRLVTLSLQNDDLVSHVLRVSYESGGVKAPEKVEDVSSKELIDARDGEGGEEHVLVAAREFERYLRETVAFMNNHRVEGTLSTPESMFTTISKHGVPDGVRLAVKGSDGKRLVVAGTLRSQPGLPMMASSINQYEVMFGQWSVCVDVPSMTDGGMTYGKPMKGEGACGFSE